MKYRAVADITDWMQATTMNKLFRDFSFLLLGFFCLLQNDAVLAQKTKLYGAPLMQRYTAKDYHANPQHNTIVTDKAGRLYVGNNEGILQFDGTSWELIELPGRQIVRDMTRARDNKIYVASFDTFGELLTDKAGKISFQELLTLSGLKGKDRHVGIVWKYSTRILEFISVQKKGSTSSVTTGRPNSIGLCRKAYAAFFHSKTPCMRAWMAWVSANSSAASSYLNPVARHSRSRPCRA